MRRSALVALVALACAACGGADEPESSPTVRSESPPLPSATATPTATPTANATPPRARARSAPPPPADAPGPEEEEGGAGDEEAARTAVRVVVDAEGVTPARTEVPAFLALRVTVRNDLPSAVTVALRGAHRGRRVAPRSRASFGAGGLRPGSYVLDAGEAGRATVVAVRP